ncbi:MAG: response regulator [Acidobacteriaceae bacterium]|nr:response regulator [Acidobacteriaceae bacterium]
MNDFYSRSNDKSPESSGKSGNGRNAAVLNSWKEIAAYLGRGVRTVQRWEREMGLPVHRPRGRERSATLAFAAELDEWLRKTPLRPNRNGEAAGDNGNGNGEARGVPNSSAITTQDSHRTEPILLSGKRKRQVIVSVDDDPALLFVREKLLESEGYTALSAADGKQALAIFATTPVDAVLLDFDMPSMNGAVVARRMKAQKPYVPVIMVSGKHVPGDIPAHCDRSIVKGDRPEMLLQTIKEVTSRRPALAASKLSAERSA